MAVKPKLGLSSKVPTGFKCLSTFVELGPTSSMEGEPLENETYTSLKRKKETFTVSHPLDGFSSIREQLWLYNLASTVSYETPFLF